MEALVHAKLSVAKNGGHVDDYLPIHEFIDSSKFHVADARHRALLHSSFGLDLAMQVFGSYIEIEHDNHTKKVSVKSIVEDHIIQDLGKIPSVQDYLQHMKIETWMSGPTYRRTTHVRFLPKPIPQELLDN